jgi:hypothetical protein
MDQAEEHYHRALALADDLGMRPVAAHCHAGLGRLYRRMDKGPQAREQLGTAVEMYRGMDMGFYAEQAEVTLGELD